jgi:hypothetical protein
MNDQKWVIKHEGKYLAESRLAPVPSERWSTDRSQAMEWDTEWGANRALRALKLNNLGAEVNTE